LGSGILDIYGDTEFGTKSFFSSVFIASVNFNANVRTSHSFQAELCWGRLTFAARDSGFGFGFLSSSEFSGPRSIGDGLTLNYSASILFNDCSNGDISITTPIPEVIFRNGMHNIYGQINGNVSVIVQNGSAVTFFQNSTYLLNFSTVLIENSSIVSIVLVDEYSDKFSSENFSCTVFMENLTIRENGKLLLHSMKSILNVKQLDLGPTGALSGSFAGMNSTKFGPQNTI
jgi:hypothetical protein